MRRELIISMIFMQTLHASVRDWGEQGHTFVIQERSLLEVFQERMKRADASGKLKGLQQELLEKIKKGVESPRAVSNVATCRENRRFTFDPTLTLMSDLKDHKGRVFAREGQTINPLDHVSWETPLLLIDGDDPAQKKLALKSGAKIVLVRGKPFELEDLLGRPVYFDQGGIIVRKFGIHAVPARIFQEAKHLVVEEFVPEGESS